MTSPYANVIAWIHLFSTSDGGKTCPIKSGYGCPLKLNGVEDSYHDCRIFFDESDTIIPGQEATGDVGGLCPELFANKIKVGLTFQIWEGRMIGEGRVLEVIKLTQERFLRIEPS